MNVFLSVFTVVVVIVIGMLIISARHSGITSDLLIIIAFFSVMLLMLVGPRLRRLVRRENVDPGIEPSRWQPKWLRRVIDLEDSRKFLLAIGVGAYALSFTAILTGIVPSQEGRWGLLHRIMHELLGPYGMPIWWFVVGTVFIAVGLRKKARQ